MGENEFYNKQILELKEFLKTSQIRPILFIGSGMSRRYIKSPDWKGLLNYLIEENPLINKPLPYFIQLHEGNLSKVASDLVMSYYEFAWDNRNLFPEELFESHNKSVYLKYKIASYFETLVKDYDKTNHEYIEELSLFEKLSPQAIITTNYDTLLEEIFPKYEVIVGQKVIHKKESTDIGHLLKIHGSANDLNSIVIEEKDYTNFEENQIYLIAKLLTYFVEHPIIFLGYSLNDKNIKSILKNVKKIQGLENGKNLKNMWFIEWSKYELSETELSYENTKNINIGDGEYIKINYIKLHSYINLFNALYQESVDIGLLKSFEAAVYNVVKSDSITDLKVDIASLRYLTDSENVLKTFTFNPSSNNSQETRSLLSFAKINQANELAVQYCYTATQLSIEVYEDKNSHWSRAYKLMDLINEHLGINIRESNNLYHISLNGINRYTEEAVTVLKKVKNYEQYKIILDDKEYKYEF